MSNFQYCLGKDVKLSLNMCSDCVTLAREIRSIDRQLSYEEDDTLYFRGLGLRSRLNRLVEKHYLDRENFVRTLSRDEL